MILRSPRERRFWMLCSYGNSGIHITGLRSCYMERGFSKETCLDIEVPRSSAWMAGKDIRLCPDVSLSTFLWYSRICPQVWAYDGDRLRVLICRSANTFLLSYQKVYLPRRGFSIVLQAHKSSASWHCLKPIQMLANRLHLRPKLRPS